VRAMPEGNQRERPSPYKFLDYYRESDAPIFFGRRKETNILVADIITTRLVILFAKTGTGKSSLINAGVRPRLHEEGYVTFWIRVEDDPAQAARKVFRDEVPQAFTPEINNKPLSEQLQAVVNFLKKPAVLFFDQFEEFFIHRDEEAARRFAEVAQVFIKEVGKIYRNRQTDVSIVFAMREEFFHEMDVFRDEIPSIFHNDSTLRLRWFDDDQAREAIVLPAHDAGLEFSPELVSLIIDELRQSPKGIEPAQLQIVCDTLWAERYFDLDGAFESRFGRVKGILKSRLEKDIATNLADDELAAFEKLLPELTHSERQTKRVRAVDGIEQSLKVAPGSLDAVIAKLEELRLVVKSKHSTGVFIEWTSDYVAGRARSLKNYVQFILLERLLHKFRDKAEAKMRDVGDSAEPRDLSTVEGAEDEFETLSMARRLLGEIGAISNGSTQTKALELLKLAMEQRDLANDALEATAQIGSEGAVQLLADALTHDDLAERTIALLRQLRTSPAIRVLAQTVDARGPFSLAAGTALSGIAKDPDPHRAREAREALARRGVDLFRLALEKGIAMQFWLQKAEEFEVPVWQVLRNLLGDQKTPEDLAQNITRLLSQIKDPRAEELRTLPRARRGQMQPISTKPAPLPHLDEKTWERLLKRIRDDKCTPVIGSGACTAPPTGADPAEWAKLKYPSKEKIALEFAADYAYPLDDQTKLERVAKYVAATNDLMAPKEGFAERYKDLSTPDFSALPNEPHRVLADLPFPVYLTSNFDDWMYRALKEYKQRDACLAICRWNRHIPENAPSFDPEFAYSAGNPLVYHFYGCTPWAESAVVSEDDYFEFLINISRDYKSLAHRVDRALGGALLFLGYTLSDWDFLVLFRLFANKLRESGNVHIAVQPGPSDTPGYPAEKAAKAVKYLNSYFGSAQVKIYWGTCQQFCEELRKRWEAFSRE
jgi:Novel STAND NTPase 1/SIR2-like domain